MAVSQILSIVFYIVFFRNSQRNIINTKYNAQDSKHG